MAVVLDTLTRLALAFPVYSAFVAQSLVTRSVCLCLWQLGIQYLLWLLLLLVFLLSLCSLVSEWHKCRHVLFILAYNYWFS